MVLLKSKQSGAGKAMPELQRIEFGVIRVRRTFDPRRSDKELCVSIWGKKQRGSAK